MDVAHLSYLQPSDDKWNTMEHGAQKKKGELYERLGGVVRWNNVDVVMSSSNNNFLMNKFLDMDPPNLSHQTQW